MTPFQARETCRRLHGDTMRWFTDEPYWHHPKRVVETIQRSQEWRDATPDERDTIETCAWLHDVVEDTDYSLADVEDDFGREVRQILDCLTHRADEPYEEYLERIMTNSIARLIKRADMADNISTLPFTRDVLWRKYAKGLTILGRVDASARLV